MTHHQEAGQVDEERTEAREEHRSDRGRCPGVVQYSRWVHERRQDGLDDQRQRKQFQHEGQGGTISELPPQPAEVHLVRGRQGHPDGDRDQPGEGRPDAFVAAPHLDHEDAHKDEAQRAPRRRQLEVQDVLDAHHDRRHGQLGRLVERDRIQLQRHVVERCDATDEQHHGQEVGILPERPVCRDRRHERGREALEQRETEPAHGVVDVRQRRGKAEAVAEDLLVQVD
mmetsp:Transcript_16791/g.50144  ORF Transcript_16791/g.50144 Transcript_16791/m.50144 type:complete len:227 (+) Transcript_16791:176-856(+)